MRPASGWERAAAVIALVALTLVACARASDEVRNGPPQRIVTVGGAVTEAVFALGAGGEVVAVDTTSVFPDETGRLPRVGYQRALSAEPILALDPDLVIASADAGPAAAIEQLRAAGVRVEVMPPAESPVAAAARIRAVGVALGRRDDADLLAARVERHAEAAAARARAPGGRPRALLMYARGGGNLMVSGRATAGAAMLELGGADNVIDGYHGYKPLSAEALVAAAPDVIVVPAGALRALGGIDGLLAQPGVAETPAGRARRVVAVDDLLLLGFGPRLGDGIDQLAAGLKR